MYPGKLQTQISNFGICYYFHFSLQIWLKIKQDNYSSPLQSHLDGLKVKNWNPALCDQTSLCNVVTKQVQGVIDGLDLANHNEPILDVLRRLRK